MEIPYEVTARRDTGLYNAKLGVWLFLASEVMLFGGLFSAYVFLRVGTQAGFDNPWPMGANVQKIWPGFINTLVLIASSVFVVFAWVSLKERKYRNYQLWMVGVILCALIFMGFKAYEYSDKLLRHHDIKLVDNSIIGGTILERTDKIRFAAEKVTVDFSGGLPGFIGEIDSDDVEFAVEGAKDGEAKTVNLSSFKTWFMDGRRRTMAEIAEKREEYHAAIKAGKTDAAMPNVNTKAVLKASFNLHANAQKLVGHSADGLNYRDRTSIAGKLIDDKIKIEVHNVNLQMIPYGAQGAALAWKYLGDDVKTRLLHSRDEKAEGLGDNLSKKVLQGPYLNFHNLHGDDHHGGGGDKKAHGGDHGSEDGAHDTLVVEIPRDQARFVTNHGPRAGTYYAIYFTMTGLHGLHVVGGALVLTFFLVFGKSLYQKNPEHLANRIEVGGLFWHFVDLVWIFLFPIMYLM
jgi:heme/copper-type cytochrome/quinol oxidase subunit 3